MTLSEIQDKLSISLQADLEQGVAWITDLRWKAFEENYPTLAETIGDILDVEEEEKDSGAWENQHYDT